MPAKFVRKTTYYPVTVYEFNLPAGWTCPHAKECKVLVDRETGKFKKFGDKFYCYAAKSERFPGVRNFRWSNFEAVKNGEPIVLPKKATHVRIHASGDFFSQRYFDMWLDVCRKNPNVKFWAFTKSIQFWLNRKNEIPENLTLVASKGSDQDDLAMREGLITAEVFKTREEAEAKGLEIDYDDSLAMRGDKSFALLDNNIKQKK